jgi:histidinol-phosphate/aromatic aminotransferase/cobyric acid decarboxylase-like protein
MLLALKLNLERLETLNNVWHKNEPTESVDINANNLQELYDFNNKLIQENEKLKKAFKILTQRIVIKAHRNFLFSGKHLDIASTTMKLTNEEYELLKEVLDNDK